ncbi:MAG: flagellar hook-associated protein FlgL [Deltaproteobacteria bacterium]|nr:flagellar hook-associated protein FlgL [Deltaproteobacteria bacterium]
MITRVTENMKFTMVTNNLFNVQNKYGTIMEQLASQKKINRPSDDPLGALSVLDFRTSKNSLKQYEKNMDNINGWMSMTESKLTGINDILIAAREIAVAQSTATADATTRGIAATALQPLIDEARALANARFGDRYLFAGSRTDTEPFSATESAASVGTTAAASENAFDGTSTSGGAYTGSVNKTYVVKIIATGALGAATYKISADGGKTWGGTATVPGTGIINVGDGMTMTFVENTVSLTANDLFSVKGRVAGYYNGNGEDMAVEVGKNNSFNYNVSGEAAFTDKGAGTVDMFTVLNDLKTALENNNQSGIATQINNLEDAQDQVLRYTSKIGSRMNSLEITKNNHTSLNEQITDLLANVEEADMAQLITDFKMKEVALQATYSMAGQINENSILNFLR